MKESMGQKILAPQHGNRLGSSWLVSAERTNKWIAKKKDKAIDATFAFTK